MKKTIWNDQHLKELWLSTLQTKQIARMLGVGETTLRRKIRSLHLPRKKSGTEGANHPCWKGGRTLNKGYVEIRIGPRKHRPEHRLVMEAHLGRPLARNEVVHHVNGNTQDNRIENLRLFSSNAEHLKESLKGKVPRWTPKGIQAIHAAAPHLIGGVLQRYAIPRVSEEHDFQLLAESLRRAREHPDPS